MRRLVPPAAVLALALGCVTPGASAPAKRDVSSLVQLEGDAILVRETIQFDFDKADIELHSTDLLDAVAEIMRTTTAITLLTIEGHTDSTGGPAVNQPLSEARAQAVKRYLESKGVSPSRLEARGFGAEHPLDTNDTEAGRARNRRVEFKVKR